MLPALRVLPVTHTVLSQSSVPGWRHAVFTELLPALRMLPVTHAVLTQSLVPGWRQAVLNVWRPP